MEPLWTFMRQSPSRKCAHSHIRAQKISLKARQMNASLRETDTDKEIDGCAGRERKQQITRTDKETEDIKQLKRDSQTAMWKLWQT